MNFVNKKEENIVAGIRKMINVGVNHILIVNMERLLIMKEGYRLKNVH